MYSITTLNLIRGLRIASLVIVCFSLGMGVTHLMELPAKAHYDDAFYAAVNSTLYSSFGLASSILFPLEIVLAGALAYLLYPRDRRSFALAAAGAGMLAASLLAWFVIVAPVNLAAQQAFESTNPQQISIVAGSALQAPSPSVIEVWRQNRSQWENGHLLAFALQLAGFVLIMMSGTVNEDFAPASANPHGAKLSISNIVL